MRAAASFDERMKYKLPLVPWIESQVRRMGATTICEVGTDKGHFLLIVREAVSKMAPCRYIGFDLSEQCINEARTRVTSDDIQFRQGDAKDWIDRAPPRTIYVFIGTLEYFTQRELESLLTSIAAGRPAAIALSEPINLDRRAEFASKPRGNLAFSHNYEHLLNKHGFKVVESSIMPIDAAVPHYEEVMLLAEVA
jgi:hypothetical protein